MKKFKILTSFILGIFIFLSSFSLVKAVDLSVDCTPGSSCTITPASTPLFSEANWFPGITVTRNLSVKNEDTSQSCDLVMTTNNVTKNPEDFTSHLTSNINNGATPVISGTLEGIFASSPLSLGTVNASSTNNYAWTVTLDPNTPNSYQNANTQFDFNLNFTCNSPTGGGSVQGISTASAPSCNSQAPTSAPTLSATSNSNNSANLVWSAVTPVDHYMIRYGTTPGNFVYGAANVGNVTSFLVQALSGGTTYYFEVAGVNGCAPGPWSNQASVTVGGAVLPVGPAQGFTQQTLGVSTSAPSPTENPTPQTLGTSSTNQPCSAKYYFWWIPLIIQALISFIYIWKRWKDRVWLLIIGLIGIISQIIHEILGCNCATGSWCPRYWLLNIIILLISVAIFGYQYNKKKTSSS